ncbi:hypothetical protein LshimejAT787_0301550 [Lyophyllum shimeji]|uniref:Uncharacterized protein n=1 Tax=Lyophyllum shimeji TaxID=47721 RepID=A0A9P3PI94_LYOSH|nr:hypothetical protein LshimejAT787_0301550 [Lyophyllum shimeji]
MARDTYLIVYKSPLFAAHWSLFIPFKSSSQPDKGVGKIIHAVGSLAEGFTVEFKRHYRPAMDSRSKTFVALGPVAEEYFKDAGDLDAAETVDVSPIDDLERRAMLVPPPGKSLHSASVGGTKTRINVQNCQTWMAQYIDLLVREGVYPDAALVAVKAAPKN